MKKEKLIRWLVWKLPHDVIMWAGYRILAHATQGDWSSEIPDSVSAFKALKRWGH